MFRRIVFPGAIIAIFFTYLSAQPTISPVPPDELLRPERVAFSVPVNSTPPPTWMPTPGFRSLRSGLMRNGHVKLRRDRERFPLRGTKSAVIFTRKSYLRKEMCKAQSIKQVVKEKGCSRQIVINRFCYGQCNSFYIPRTDKQNIMEPAFKSCSFCSPHRYTWLRVTLRCHNSKSQRFKRIKVKVIKRCKCMAIEANLLS